MSAQTVTEKILTLMREKRLTYSEAAAELGRRCAGRRKARRQILAQLHHRENRMKLK